MIADEVQTYLLFERMLTMSPDVMQAEMDALPHDQWLAISKLADAEKIRVQAKLAKVRARQLEIARYVIEGDTPEGYAGG